MSIRHSRLFLQACALVLLWCSTSSLQGQGSKQIPETHITDPDTDHVEERNAWFYRGRIIPGKPSAELRRRAYASKVLMRRERAAALAMVRANNSTSISISTAAWTPLGPVPLASDATGNGTQDYHQVAGRAVAVAIDSADPTGNTVYVGGAQSGVWKSTNASASAGNVNWTALSDDQATLSIGAIAIQPGNNDPTKSVILAATGEANNSGDSYFGLGILRSGNAGNTWSLASTANNGTLSFSGLGGTRMAFSTAAPNTVVAAMATTSEGLITGAVTPNTTRGLYTSRDAGQTWTYNALLDYGLATDATSATSVVYNASAGKFFAAIRYHGFYSSPDGLTWTRLSNQPGGSALGASSCPPQSTSNGAGCPIYRAELAVVPNRNEMYAWYVYFSSTGDLVDGGIWQTLNGGTTAWTQINDSGITNCGDYDGCGVEQGSYNLELLTVPNGSTGTDLYAGAINIYKCKINSQNPTCSTSPFLNLTHVYGCDPIAAPAHVHPDQHMIAATILAGGSALMYFANDGGIYRAMDGINGLSSGSCAGTNQFDDLNQNLGSMTQFVSFSQHPTDPNTLLGGTQDNGSPATSQATTNLNWGNVLGGDGGYNAIDPNAASTFYASNPDIAPGGLSIQRCTNSVNCNNYAFSSVVTSSTLGGDDGAFYFPYLLDPQPPSGLLVGTCRIWRGPRNGGSFTALSPNFDTLGLGTCNGSEVNQVRAIAAGGATDSNGSTVIYATTSGLGPLDGPAVNPAGGRVWTTVNATGGPSSFADVTNNGPQGNINPNQFPISSAAIDSSDPSGQTAFVTIMGFTGGGGHVWKTTNAGLNWADFTANLPDSPANAVVIDPTVRVVYVGTDVGVFASSTLGTPNWTEVGPLPGTTQSGFLPNVAVTALALFKSGGTELLRASTYGRGIWQFDLNATPNYKLAVSNSPLTAFPGQTATFNGIATALNGYSNSVTLSCVADATDPPSTCTISPSVVNPESNTPFTVTAGGVTNDYNFYVQGVGADPSQITEQAPVTLHVVNFAITSANPASVSVGRGNTSSPVSFQVTAAGSFNQAVTISCSNNIPNAVCNFTPGSSVSPISTTPVNMTVTVTVPAGTTTGNYPVTIRATTSGAPATLTTSFTLTVTSNPDFQLTWLSSLPNFNVGSTGSQTSISIDSQDGFSSTVNLNCSVNFSAGVCSLTPSSVNSFPATSTLTIDGASFAAGSYSVNVTGTSGPKSHLINVSFEVGDYTISGTQTVSATPGAQASASLTLASVYSYTGKINATCDSTALAGSTCSIQQALPINLASGGTAALTATISTPNNAATGTYKIKINTNDTSGAPAHSYTVSLVIGEDFELISSPPNQSQTVSAGQKTGPYNLTLQPVGSSFDGNISLTCSGLPSLAACQFNPSSPIALSNSSQAVVLTITTTAPTSNSEKSAGGLAFFTLVSMSFLGFVWVHVSPGRRKMHNSVKFGTLILLSLLLASCGGASAGGSGGGGSQPGTPAGTYEITVTGSSTGVPADAGQSTHVTVVVN